MTLMRTRLIRMSIAILSILGILASSFGVSAQGNSGSAQLCENDGWQALYRIQDGSVFRNQGECVRYAAQGRTVIDANTRRCFDDYGALAPAGTPELPFESLEDCLAYGADGGEIVAHQPPDPGSVTVTWSPSGTENYCIPTFTLTGFPDGTYTVILRTPPFPADWPQEYRYYIVEVVDGSGMNPGFDVDDLGWHFEEGWSATVTVNGVTSEPFTVAC